MRVTKPIFKKRDRRLKSGGRWEFHRSMYGNVCEIIDHERMIFYRQDLVVDPEGDLFNGYLPFFCDYCQDIVSERIRIKYTLVFEMLVRPHTNPEWKVSTQTVYFACCNQCIEKELPIPEKLIGYHLTKLYQDDLLVFSQEKKK